nr:SGNH/GDSL hydrolase family protein [Lyngbya aestuarii]
MKLLGKLEFTETLHIVKHNSLLTEALNDLSLLPDINLIPLDMFSLYTQMFNNPEQFGFTTVTEACLSPDASLFPNLTPPQSVSFTICDQPDKYVFWDGIHPTTASHAVLAEFALAQLHEPESVPEPRNWVALTILSLGGLLYKTLNSSKKNIMSSSTVDTYLSKF